MSDPGMKNKRKHRRIHPDFGITINDGKPFKGGTLYDLSSGGIAVSYPQEIKPTSNPIEVGQNLTLIAAECIKHQTNVVRIFPCGFACEFTY